MQEKEPGKETESLPGNIVKETRKERRRMPLWTLLGGVLIVGTALGVVLAHDYRRTNREVLTFPASGEQKSAGVPQAQSVAPPAPEPLNVEPAPIPVATESANVPVQQPAPSVSPLEDCHCTDSASIPQTTEVASVPAGEPEFAEVSAEPSWEPDNPKPAVVKHKKVKHKTAKKKQHSHIKTRYVTFFPERQNYHHGFPAVSN